MDEAGPDQPTGLDVVENSAGKVVLDQLDEHSVALRVAGSLDLALAPVLRRVVERVHRLRPPLVIVDLTGVEFLASVGMAELLRTQDQLHQHSRLRLVAADRVVLRPLTMTRLIDRFDVYPSLDVALVGR